jgi:hypothetical protein
MATQVVAPSLPGTPVATRPAIELPVILMLATFLSCRPASCPWRWQRRLTLSPAALLSRVDGSLLAAWWLEPCGHHHQIGLYRVLFLCLLHVDGRHLRRRPDDPGILVPNLFARFAGSAVALSAYLSLAVPGVFFAASYAPGMSRLERRLPFWPAGWLVLFVTAALVAYGAVAIKTWILAQLPYSVPPYSTGLAIASILLFFLAAAGQARTYRITRLETQASLIAAFVLLAEAMAAMVLFPVWSWGWWYYHPDAGRRHAGCPGLLMERAREIFPLDRGGGAALESRSP